MSLNLFVKGFLPIFLPIGTIAALLCSAATLAQSADPHAMHGSMQMQGGDAPEYARDPHAYADGSTLTTGPYAMPDSRHLKHANEHRFWSLLGDRLEYDTDKEILTFDLKGWYGTTYDRLLVKLEGDAEDRQLEESQTELLWGHAVSAYFDTQAGLRLDQYAEGQNRQWLALGIQGLAPYWFELDLTVYLGESGRTALSLEAEYELLLTQRWVLQARTELSIYAKDDAANGLGSGLSDAATGLRLRYEFSRQFAPYAGVEWHGRFGNTADLAQANGQSTRDSRYLVGIRFWF